MSTKSSIAQTEKAYERRVVAFGDILGWADKCRDEGELRRLLEAVTGIQLHAKGLSEAKRKGVATREYRDILFTFFSDSFAVSGPIEHCDGLFRILSWRTTNLLQEGFLVRGGVTVGKIYHSPEIIFGPALVEAVEIEKTACFPRFLCSDRLIEQLDHTSYKNEVVFKDCYQDWVVNTWCGGMALLIDIARNVEREISTIDNAKHGRKWLYVNEMLHKMHELKNAIDDP